jgi:hypothetical protein
MVAFTACRLGVVAKRRVPARLGPEFRSVVLIDEVRYESWSSNSPSTPFNSHNLHHGVTLASYSLHSEQRYKDPRDRSR